MQEIFTLFRPYRFSNIPLALFPQIIRLSDKEPSLNKKAPLAYASRFFIKTHQEREAAPEKPLIPTGWENSAQSPLFFFI